MKLALFFTFVLASTNAFAQQAPGAIEHRPPSQPEPSATALPERQPKNADLSELLRAQTTAIRALSDKVEALEERVRKLEERGH